jgi:hypothetical protein
MDSVAEWTATAVTIIAALMTAANLGVRFTGWGFAVFALGSVAWITTGYLRDLQSLVITNGVLLLVNLFGVWRWLGRQARYEKSGERVHDRSRWARVPTLFSGGALIGASVKGRNGKPRGEIVDAMLECDGKRLAYLVVSEGGVAGAGETLRAIPPDRLDFENDEIRCDLSDREWQSLQPIENDRWPTEAPAPGSAAAAASSPSPEPAAR